MSIKSSILLGHIGSILLGGFIYVGFRQSDLIMFHWFDQVGLTAIIESIRNLTMPYKGSLSNWLLYSLPDGLWLFSYSSLIIYLWKNKVNRQNVIWLLLIPALAIAFEIGQAIELIPGTFDAIDLLCYIGGAFLPLVIYKPNYKLKSITL